MDFEHQQAHDKAIILMEMGYEFEVDANRYFVKFQGKGLGGASVKLPREKPLHWRHAKANRRDNLIHAVSLAEKHCEEQRKNGCASSCRVGWH